MGFRCVVIKNRSKLDLRMNYLVCRNAEEEKKIYIPEISTLILDSTAISLTCALISELIKNDVKKSFAMKNTILKARQFRITPITTQLQILKNKSTGKSILRKKFGKKLLKRK